MAERKLGARKGLSIDPDWIALEFDARLWTYEDAAKAMRVTTLTVHRMFYRERLSRHTLRKLLDALARHQPIKEVEEALPTAARETLARFRSNGHQPRYHR